MICLGIDLLVLILIGILWTSWICDLVSVINFGKFLAILASNISFALFSSPSGIPIVHMLYLLNTFHCSWISVLFFHSFFSLPFSLKILFWLIFKLTDSFLGYVQATNESIRGILHFSVFDMIVFLIYFDSFLGFPSLRLHYPYVLTFCLLFPIESLTY